MSQLMYNISVQIIKFPHKQTTHCNDCLRLQIKTVQKRKLIYAFLYNHSNQPCSVIKVWGSWCKLFIFTLNIKCWCQMPTDCVVHFSLIPSLHSVGCYRKIFSKTFSLFFVGIRNSQIFLIVGTVVTLLQNVVGTFGFQHHISIFLSKTRNSTANVKSSKTFLLFFI